MNKGESRKGVYRKEYRPYGWDIDHVSLHFDIREAHTDVTSELAFGGRDERSPGDGLVLNGCDHELLYIALDGRELGEDEYGISGERMVISDPPPRGTLHTRVRIRPAENSALEGLYVSGDFLLTQCEPEGFRKITWFPDRPDVMTRYSVTIEAQRERYPVLLSNGNATDGGDAGAGRHWRRWEDPFPKPCYLFALVAGDLVHVEDEFITASGRKVTLRIYVEQENIDRCAHAMQSLIKAMRWDEERFALEYDLDVYNIVATNDFNMGAMENKSLNIFNARYVLARPDTATDIDYQSIETVIGHEYFHNWTGNRVTCRDWFQLTLKEGLTVFRDEEFSADMQSRAVKRIHDTRELRNRQFPEDAGPMSHPIRPDHYMEINNFYTATVYQKGAAVIRMYHTLLGEEGFQKGMRLYFERHDGQAVTCDDFLAAMADANDVDLVRFARWYGQAGTPEVTVRTEYDAERARFTVHLSQHTPPTQDQPEKLPLVIPFAIGLLESTGKPISLRLENDDTPAAETRVLVLTEAEHSFHFLEVHEAPVPSLLRDFSAPVKVRYEYSEGQLAILLAHDGDDFARWEAAQRLAQSCILDQVAARARGESMHLNPVLADAFRGLLEDERADLALIAEILTLPGEDYLGDQMEEVDVDGIHAARTFVRRSLTEKLQPLFAERYVRCDDGRAYDNGPAAIARRSLKNVCLAYLASVPAGHDLAERQWRSSDNMTDTLAAIRAQVVGDAPTADAALADFEKHWKDNPLVMDKWFLIQATRPGHDTVDRVEALLQHPAFSLRNPNKVRSLIGAFSLLNPTGFHCPDGRGYRFLADQVIALDRSNPQIAARMVSAFNRWPRFDPDRRRLMRSELQRIAAVDGLSGDVEEIVSHALRMGG